jgi:CHASE1-domain containing sensor protein
MALSQDSWVAIAVAAVSAVSAITAAVVATVLAAQAQKVKELETRIADRKAWVPQLSGVSGLRMG